MTNLVCWKRGTVEGISLFKFNVLCKRGTPPRNVNIDK